MTASTHTHESEVSDMLDPIIEWEAPEHSLQEELSPRDISILVGLLILGIILGLTLFSVSFLVAFCLLVSAYVLHRWLSKKNPAVQYNVNLMGIQKGDRLYPWSEYESFRLMRMPHDPYHLRLLMRDRRPMSSDKEVMIPSEIAPAIEPYLVTEMIHNPDSETMAEALTRHLKL